VLTSVDGDLLGGSGPDTFRIRIWDPSVNPSGNGSNYVYDNDPSGNLYNDPSGTPLGGGEVRIHKSNQTAAEGPGPNTGTGPSLTLEQLQPFVKQAITRWQAAGATPTQLSPLAQFKYEIVSLPPGILAMTGPGIIWVSPNADGYGWFVDPNPASDSAFTPMASSPAQDHMDLLSVMAHELGHIILNMNEGSQPNDIMTEALLLGVRRLPTPQDLGLQPSALWVSSHTSTGLEEPRPTADGVHVLLRDSLFAAGLQPNDFLAASPVQQPEALTAGPIFLRPTAPETETWFASRQLQSASDMVHWASHSQERADTGKGWLDNGLLDQLAQDTVR
jgi:hypothetical protein